MASSYPAAGDSLVRAIDGSTKVKQATPNPIMDAVEAVQDFVGESGKSQAYNTDILAQIFSLLPTIKLSYVSTTQVQASAGVSRPQNAAGSERVMRKNTSTTTITPTLGASKNYYVYADGDAAATTVAFEVKEVGVAVTATHYELIGGFSTNGSSQIIDTSVWSVAGTRVVDIQYKFTSAKSTTTTAFPCDNTKPQKTEGIEVVNLDMFIQKTTNLVMLLGFVSTGLSSAQIMGCGIFSTKNATPADAVAAALGSYPPTNGTGIMVIATVRSESSVGDCNYALNAGSNSGATFYINGDPVTTLQVFNGVAMSGLIAIQLEKGT